jgi:hypothetical protein
MVLVLCHCDAWSMPTDEAKAFAASGYRVTHQAIFSRSDGEDGLEATSEAGQP